MKPCQKRKIRTHDIYRTNYFVFLYHVNKIILLIICHFYKRPQFMFSLDIQLNNDMRFPTMWYVRPAKPQIRLHIRAVYKSLCKSLEHSITIKLLTEQHLQFLSLKGGCTGSAESTLIKMPHYWKSHFTAQYYEASLLIHLRSPALEVDIK